MAVFDAPEKAMVTIEADPLLAKVSPEVTIPRPGHADLSGALKYGYTDLRNIIERASARETAARVAVGVFAKQLLVQFGVEIGSYVSRIGTTGTDVRMPLTREEQALVERSPVRAYPHELSGSMVETIVAAQECKETLGGTFVVYANGVPPGLGSHVHWDRRLDGQLAQALMAIPGIKGVECGAGFGAAELPGSEMHDAIGYHPQTGWHRTGNQAGGIEGGISNGQPIILRAAMKPIPTLYQGLPSVDLKTGEPRQAGAERSDLTAVPAAGVVAEAMVAWVLAVAFQEKFGGDTLPEMKQAWMAYQEGLGGRRD
jgi:chorismate synthase